MAEKLVSPGFYGTPFPVAMTSLVVGNSGCRNGERH